MVGVAPDTERDRLAVIEYLRAEHGFSGPTSKARAAKWSRAMLMKAGTGDLSGLPRQLISEECEDGTTWVPKNAPILDLIKQRFGHLGFDWWVEEILQGSRNRTPRRVVRFRNYPTVGKGRMPTLFDLLFLPIEFVDQAREADAGLRVQRMGTWQVKISGEAVRLSPSQADLLADFLNQRWLPVVRKEYGALYAPNLAMKLWKVPSVIVRFDMAPLSEGDSIPGVYEVEANPAGYGIMHLAGVPVEREVASALQGLGIQRIGYGVAASRFDQGQDLATFIGMLAKEGIGAERVDLASPPSNLPLWLRGGQEDMTQLSRVMGQCLLLHYDGGGDKGYLKDLTGARSVAECPDPFESFSGGFVIKPQKSWGTRQVEVWTPERPWKDVASTASQMQTALSTIRTSGRGHEFLVQPFFPPQPQDDGSFRIWRVFAVWTPKGYRVIGGIWSQRTSLKVHGASDTVSGPISV